MTLPVPHDWGGQRMLAGFCCGYLGIVWGGSGAGQGWLGSPGGRGGRGGHGRCGQLQGYPRDPDVQWRKRTLIALRFLYIRLCYFITLKYHTVQTLRHCAQDFH